MWNFISEMIKSSAYKDSGADNFILHYKDTNLFELKFHHDSELLTEFFQKFENLSENNKTNLIKSDSRKISQTGASEEANEFFNIGC